MNVMRGGGDEQVQILLVDDQIRNLETLEVMLEPTGCRLVRAQSGQEALLALLKDEFAAIVMDMRMPGMSGLELARLVKQRKRTQHVPILFLTAHMVDEADILRGYGAGAVDYLTKPLKPDILRSKIAVFVDLYRKSRALARANAALQEEIEARETAQEALRKANQELEQRVQERTLELIRAHQEVRENEERLRLAFEAVRMGSWMWDVNQDHVTWSGLRGSGFGFGGSFAELLDRMHAEDRQGFAAAIQAALATGTSCTCEVRFREDDGSLRWALVSGRVLPEESGRSKRLAGIDLDITDRKRAEERLHEADRKKDAFLATLAHELRNPLAPIGTAVQVLRDAENAEPGGPRLRQPCEVIARQVRQMARLIDDLMDVSRIGGDKLALQLAPIDLQSIVSAAVETSLPLIEQYGHTLNVSLPGKPVLLTGDLTRLAQVFSNLLNNAAKYTEPNGGISLIAEQAGSEVLVRVTDTGIGIPPEALDRIFDLFVQVGEGQERSRGGLGIGLTLVQRLVLMHGGSVEARSQGPGRGSEFVVRLPCLAETPVLCGEQDGLAAASSAPSMRVLVVDDNQDAADMLGLLLATHGHAIEVAHDGPRAVECAERFRPDVVLLDIGLPGMDGHEVARVIRQQPGGGRVSLVAVTGWGQDVDRVRSREAGFDRHLVKPVEPNALLAMLEDLAATNPSSQGPEAQQDSAAAGQAELPDLRLG